MRREDPARDAVPVSRNAERSLPDSRRTEHRTEDIGGNRAHQGSGYKAWPLHQFGSPRETAFTGSFEDDSGYVPATVARRKIAVTDLPEVCSGF